MLVNNAGTDVQGLTWVVGDRDEAREVLETNLWSPLALVAALGRAGPRHIVNVGSMTRVSPFPHLGHYAASRAGLITPGACAGSIGSPHSGAATRAARPGAPTCMTRR